MTGPASVDRSPPLWELADAAEPPRLTHSPMSEAAGDRVAQSSKGANRIATPKAP